MCSAGFPIAVLVCPFSTLLLYLYCRTLFLIIIIITTLDIRLVRSLLSPQGDEAASGHPLPHAHAFARRPLRALSHSSFPL